MSYFISLMLLFAFSCQKSCRADLDSASSFEYLLSCGLSASSLYLGQVALFDLSSP